MSSARKKRYFYSTVVDIAEKHGYRLYPRGHYTYIVKGFRVKKMESGMICNWIYSLENHAKNGISDCGLQDIVENITAMQAELREGGE